MNILSTFYDEFVVQCVKLMVSKFLHLWFLLFDCVVCHQNVTCLRPFTRYGHCAGEVGEIIVARHAVVSEIAVPKIRAFSCSFRLC